MLSTTQLSHFMQNFTITGGGRLTVKNTAPGTATIRWNDRLTCTCLFRSSGTIIYELYCPASGSAVKRYASGSSVATDLAVSVDGIPLLDWDSLWYELPTTAAHPTINANYKVVDYNSTFAAPLPNWVFIAMRFPNSNGGDTVPYIKWWPAMVNVPIPTGDDTVSYQTNILQLGSAEATRITLDGSSGNLTAGRITSRADGSAGTIRCSPPVGNTGESTIGFYRNGGGTIGAAGDQWLVGQGSWGVGDRGFGIGCNTTGVCLGISSAGRVTANAGILDIVPKTIGGGTFINLYWKSDRNTSQSGDMWYIGLGAAADDYTGQFRIGANAISGEGGGVALVISDDRLVTIPGALRVGGYAAGMKPFLSCCVNSAGGLSYNCGQQIARPVRNDEGRYTVGWDDAHPFGTNYVPMLNIDGQTGFAVGFINHSDQNNKSLVVVTKDVQGLFADRGFYLLIT
jgi:hypothetical protein